MSANVALTTVSPTAPSPPFPGELWHNSTTGLLYVYDGSTSQWILAHPQSTTSGANPPASPSPGDMWWNTSDNEMSVYDGTNWVAMVATPTAGSITYVQATAPTGTIATGALWFNTSSNELMIWDGSAWQEAQGIAGPQGPPGPTGATGPQGLPGSQVPGVTDGSNAAAGYVGEFVNISMPSGIPLTSETVNRSVMSMALTPGDWDVSGNVEFAGDGQATLLYNVWGAMGTAAQLAGTMDTWPEQSTFSWFLPNFQNVTTVTQEATIGPMRVSTAVPVTIFLACGANFDSGGAGVWGAMWARRMR